MSRVAIVVCLMLCTGCFRVPNSDTEGGGPDSELVDGGTVKNVDRDKVDEYFSALTRVQSADEEKKLLTEFAEWLQKNGYKLEVEDANGKHVLRCPYFPPVTPWTSHSFFDVTNLELLPQ